MPSTTPITKIRFNMLALLRANHGPSDTLRTQLQNNSRTFEGCKGLSVGLAEARTAPETSRTLPNPHPPHPAHPPRIAAWSTLITTLTASRPHITAKSTSETVFRGGPLLSSTSSAGAAASA